MIVFRFDASDIPAAELAFLDSDKWGVISVYATETSGVGIAVKNFGVTLSRGEMDRQSFLHDI